MTTKKIVLIVGVVVVLGLLVTFLSAALLAWRCIKWEIAESTQGERLPPEQRKAKDGDGRSQRFRQHRHRQHQSSEW